MPDEKTWEKELAQLQEKESEALRGGGEERLEKQRKMGKMTARERIDHIMDPGSFVEVNMLPSISVRISAWTRRNSSVTGLSRGTEP